MSSISLCMIVKNEEDVLDRCLSNASDLVDEIIIVDTGSTDKTKEIARKYTSNVYDFEWIDDFSAARNYSFSKATKDYCLWLDADDIILDDDRHHLRSLAAELDPSTDIVMMKYNVAFDDAGNPTFSYYRERIIKNNGLFVWLSPIHEAINLHGKIIYSDIAITHSKLHPTDPDRNLNIFEKMIEKNIQLDPRQQYYYGRELYYHQQYEKAASIFSAFLDAPQGWVENKIEACRNLSYCYSGLKQDHQALRALYRSFEYDQPRAEICCDIGKCYFDKQDYRTAIFWYELAATRIRNDRNGGFIQQDCYDYIPFMQLCVCYDKLGQKEIARLFNEKAGEIKPNSPAYLYNKQYFSVQISSQ